MEVNMLNQACSTLGLAVLLAAVGIVPAHTQTKRTAPDEYTGTTANMTQGSGSKLSFQILQWSSEGDRERVLSVIGNASKEKNDQPDLAKALEALPTVGYIWATGPLGYSLKYAHRVTLPDGGERVVVMTSRPLGSWEHPAWKVNRQEPDPPSPFTVVELRLEDKGSGEGKMSLTTPITVDNEAKTLGLANYDSAAVLLKDVQHEPKPYWARES